MSFPADIGLFVQLLWRSSSQVSIYATPTNATSPDTVVIQLSFNELRPRQSGHHFPEDIFKHIFSNENVFEFGLNFYWRLFLHVRVQLTIFQHGFRLWLGAVRATRHYLNQWWLVYWRIYASLGLNALNTCCLKKFGASWNMYFSNCIHKQSVEFYCPSLIMSSWKMWLRENAK